MTTTLCDHWRDVPESAWRGPNFSSAETACRGTSKLLVNEPALDKLQVLRDALAKPLIVRCAYRSLEHNRAIGGAERSKNMEGAAFDIARANHARRLSRVGGNRRRSGDRRLAERAKGRAPRLRFPPALGLYAGGLRRRPRGRAIRPHRQRPLDRRGRLRSCQYCRRFRARRLQRDRRSARRTGGPARTKDRRGISPERDMHSSVRT